MTTVIIALIIPAAIIYVIGAIIWVIYWLIEWSYSTDQESCTEAARNTLHTPLWPLPALRIAAQAIAILRDDAKGNP